MCVACNISEPVSPSKGLVKRSWTHTFKESDSQAWVGPEICIFYEVSSDTEVADPGTTLWEPLIYTVVAAS